MNRIAVLSVLLVALAMAACGGGSAKPEYEVVEPASISPGSAVPAPNEEVILTLSGDISVKNVGDSLAFDTPTLEKLGLMQYEVTEPFLKKEVSFTGVLMSDLLKFAGVKDSASVVHMVALDDYETDITFADIKRWPIMVAIRADGQYIPVDEGGPTRIVFPYDTHPEIEPLRYDDLWIWSLKSMKVK